MPTEPLFGSTLVPVEFTSSHTHTYAHQSATCSTDTMPEEVQLCRALVSLVRYITFRPGHRNPGSDNALVLRKSHVATCLGDEDVWHPFAHLTPSTAIFRHGPGRAPSELQSMLRWTLLGLQNRPGLGNAKQQHTCNDKTESHVMFRCNEPYACVSHQIQLSF